MYIRRCYNLCMYVQGFCQKDTTKDSPKSRFQTENLVETTKVRAAEYGCEQLQQVYDITRPHESTADGRP